MLIEVMRLLKTQDMHRGCFLQVSNITPFNQRLLCKIGNVICFLHVWYYVDYSQRFLRETSKGEYVRRKERGGKF